MILYLTEPEQGCNPIEQAVFYICRGLHCKYGLYNTVLVFLLRLLFVGHIDFISANTLKSQGKQQVISNKGF